MIRVTQRLGANGSDALQFPSQKARMTRMDVVIVKVENSLRVATPPSGSSHQQIAQSPYPAPMVAASFRVGRGEGSDNLRRSAYHPIQTVISACQASPVNEIESGRDS